VLLANRTLLIVVLLIRLAITTLRQVLSAGEARNGIASGTGDDVALEENVDGLERYTWRIELVLTRRTIVFSVKGVLPLVSGMHRMAYTTMTMQALPKTRNVPYVILASMMGVSFAITKLNSHWVIKAAAIVRERTWLGYNLSVCYSVVDRTKCSRLTAHSALKTKGIGPHPNE
jgi:hypothetical protein